MTVEHLIDRAASGEEEYDKAVEHLVDTTGISYDEARLRVGEPPYELYTPQEASRGVVFGKEITRRTIDRPRRRSGHGPQYGEEEGVGYPGGVPYYYLPSEPLSDEQVERNHINAEKIRAMLREDRERKQ